MDAVFPTYLPAAGAATEIPKLGDFLNAAKALLSSLAYGANDLRQERVIYNLLDDPTVELATRPPEPIVIGGFTFESGLLQVPVNPIEPVCLTCPPGRCCVSESSSSRSGRIAKPGAGRHPMQRKPGQR